MKTKLVSLGLVAAVLGLSAREAQAADIAATPETYKALLTSLTAGDTLRLGPGHYPRLNITNLNGTPSAWITVTGPTSGEPAIIDADSGPCCNTVEIVKSSYFALEHVTIDGKNIDGAFAISAKDGASNRVHNIRIEACDIINHSGGQQHNGISTKTPTWGWIVRGNRILDAGTGMYFGNSDGTFPFVGGIIENNLIQNTIGYNLQIKYQKPRPTVEGMPTGPSTTIIRNNVFLKSDQPSPDGDRPNVLVGGFPETGAGSEDRYEIYGNVFAHNPRESLLQASGRVSIHDNVFVDAPSTRAILLRNHDLPLRQALVYNNTIYGTPAGIVFGSPAPQGDAVLGNLIFAATASQGPITNQKDNLTDTVANAAMYVNAPSNTLGAMNFYPLAGKATGTPIDLSTVATDTDYAVDFNGTSKGTFTYRGAYAGEGTNPGWQIDAGLKQGGGSGPGADGGTSSGGSSGTSGGSSGGGGPSGGASGGPSGGASGGASGGGAGGAGDGADDSGCACSTTGSATGSWWGLGLSAGLALAAVRRRGRNARPS